MTEGRGSDPIWNSEFFRVYVSPGIYIISKCLKVIQILLSNCNLFCIQHSWISWDIGPAHIVSFSTEVYFFLEYGLEQIVQQYEWLERDLKVRID